MNALQGWALAAAALGLGFWSYGWPGLALAISVIAFWLLLQFNRALRVMRAASGAPVGHVPSAVMLHAKLRRGLLMQDILRLTKSLGQRVSEQPERWRWADDGGASVTITMAAGRCADWTLERPD